MAQIAPEVSQVLEKALALSTRDRGLLIDRLIASSTRVRPRRVSKRRGRRRSRSGWMMFDLEKSKSYPLTKCAGAPPAVRRGQK